MPELVNPDNFVRAETHRYFGRVVADGPFGRFRHDREFSPPDARRVVRENRDTLYSTAVFDLDAGPVTINVPDTGARFVALQIISEDHYVPAVFYGAGRHHLTRADIGTRYALAAMRILIDPNDPADAAAVHAIQDAITVDQAEPGRFEVPAWDEVSQKTVRDALLQLATTLPDTRRMFGPEGSTDPVRHLIGSASAWGGNPERDALYLNVVPPANDGETAYRLTVREVPVDAFWSVTVYDAEGYFILNPRNAFSVNNITAARSADGAVVIQFGGPEDAAANHLPITAGWNYLVRLYRPQPAILDGQWTFPSAEPLN